MTEPASGMLSPDALELAYERIFAAPPERVFHAWTDAGVLARWWGPKSFTIPEVSLDVRVGGAWMTLMRAPDGAEYRVGGVYREIDPPRRLVFTWAWLNDGVRGHETTVTVEFEAARGGTLMRFHQARFADSGDAARHNEGWTSAFECLDHLIAEAGLA